MSQSLLDDQSSPAEHTVEARLQKLEVAVNSQSCELALLRQHMDDGFVLMRSDMASRLAEAGRASAECIRESERRSDDNLKAVASQLQSQMVELDKRQEARMVEFDKRQEARMVELSRRMDAFSRWMVGLSFGVAVLLANMASRLF